jgi:histidinol-phosphate aminotransferase
VDVPVKLDQNECAEDVPERLKQRVLAVLGERRWNRYPEPHAETIRGLLSQHENWPARGIVVAAGSNVLIGHLILLAGLGRRVVTVAPSFALYALQARLLECEPVEVPLLDGLAIDPDAIIDALGSGERGVLFLPSPLAPSGGVFDDDVLEQIVAAAADRYLVVVDEAYHHFAGMDARELVRRHANVVSLRTFSKAWGLAGARVGYALASDDVAEALRKLVAPFGLNEFQSLLVEAALSDPDSLERHVATVVAERERVTAALASHPTWRVYPSKTNFLLIRTPDAAQAYPQLLKAGISVRRQDDLPGLQGCVRVTIGTPAENDAFLLAAGA